MTVGAIPGSGINAVVSSGTARDSNWKIVALPYSGTGAYTPPDGQSVVSGSSYAAYVPRNVASPWLGSGTVISGGTSGLQTGYTTSGTTYHWIALDPSVWAVSTALASVSTGTQSTWYKWIAAQTFTIPEDNNYFFNFPSAVDNRLDYFVNGTIDYTDPRQPTISGGFQITTTNTAPGQFLAISINTNASPIFLAAGEHTAYMVLTDLGRPTGLLIGPTEFSKVHIPEPSTGEKGLPGK
ncbi:MAG: hypothetical protein ACKOD2_16825 [Ilumatobacteraceae bacterium]